MCSIVSGRLKLAICNKYHLFIYEPVKRKIVVRRWLSDGRHFCHSEIKWMKEGLPKNKAEDMNKSSKNNAEKDNLR